MNSLPANIFSKLFEQFDLLLKILELKNNLLLLLLFIYLLFTGPGPLVIWACGWARPFGLVDQPVRPDPTWPHARTRSLPLTAAPPRP